MHPARSSLLAALLTVAVACSGSATAVTDVPDGVGPPSDDPVVAVDDNFFDPQDVVVTVGTTVTWVWEGDIVHDVVGEGFRSEVVNVGEFEHTFEQPGSHPYVCSLHPGMEGVVHVIEAGR